MIIFLYVAIPVCFGARHVWSGQLQSVIYWVKSTVTPCGDSLHGHLAMDIRKIVHRQDVKTESAKVQELQKVRAQNWTITNLNVKFILHIVAYIKRVHNLKKECPWKVTVEIYNFFVGYPSQKNKTKITPWCPCHFKNKAYRDAQTSLKKYAFSGLWIHCTQCRQECCLHIHIFEGLSRSFLINWIWLLCGRSILPMPKVLF